MAFWHRDACWRPSGWETIDSAHRWKQISAFSKYQLLRSWLIYIGVVYAILFWIRAHLTVLIDAPSPSKYKD